MFPALKNRKKIYLLLQCQSHSFCRDTWHHLYNNPHINSIPWELPEKMSPVVWSHCDQADSQQAALSIQAWLPGSSSICFPHLFSLVWAKTQPYNKGQPPKSLDLRHNIFIICSFNVYQMPTLFLAQFQGLVLQMGKMRGGGETLLHEALYSTRNLDKQWMQSWDQSRDLPKSSPVVKIKVPGPTIVILNIHPISQEPWGVLWAS